MNGDRYPRHLFRDDFEGPGDREQLRRWRRRQDQRALEQDVERALRDQRGSIRSAFLEPSASEAVRSSAQAGGATRAFRASSGDVGYVSVSGGQP